MLLVPFLLVLVSVEGTAQTDTITASEAANHIGEPAVVWLGCQHEVAARSRGKPTFINLDRPYPNHIFTALIWGEDRPKFERPEETFAAKRICVSGTIRSYRGMPEIIVRQRADQY